METLRIREKSLPMRIVSPRCSMGGFDTISSKRFCVFSNPKPEARTSPLIDTVPAAPSVMSTTPDGLLSSRRIGRDTLNVRAKPSLTAEPAYKPATTTERAKHDRELLHSP